MYLSYKGCHLLHQLSTWSPIYIPSVPLPIQSQANGLGKAVEDGPIDWVRTTSTGTLEEVPTSRLWPGSPLPFVANWRIKPANDISLSPSLPTSVIL